MNYNLKCKEIINSLKHRPKLLLHACCAPCSSYTLEYLSKYFDITIYFYNPNISPIEEYKFRLDELNKFVKEYPFNVKIVDGEYENELYEATIKGLENEKEGGSRCFKCYYLRMEKAAKYAKNNNFEYFTTTLSISPYKNSKWINEIGEKLENEFDIKYLYADLKKENGYKRSIELSKEFNLYRQNYCGCKYSKRED